MKPLVTVSAAALALGLATPALAAPWEQAAGIDWSRPPALGPEPSYTPPVPRRARLANGMELVVVENHRLPLVAMTLVVRDAGSAQDPAGKAGLAAITADLLDEGAGGLGALELSTAFDQLGASLELSVGEDAATLSVSTLTRTLDPTLDLVAKVLTAPAFDAKESQRVLADWITALELRPDEPRELASLLLRAVIYGLTSAYGHPSDGALADARTVTRADAERFYAERWTPRAMTLVVAGDVDARALATRLDAALGAWRPAGKKAQPLRTPAARLGTRLWIVDRPGAEQADVRVGVHGLSLKDARQPALDVLALVLGGSFSSRLNHRLREELGWTYGVRAGLHGGAGVGPFVISTALVAEHAVEGVAEILRLVAELAARDLPAEELAKARSNLVRELPQRFATNAATVDAFAELVETGLPLDYYAGYAARIRKVTAKDVRTLARALLPAGKLVVVAVGDAASLRPGLEALIGPAALATPELVPVPGSEGR